MPTDKLVEHRAMESLANPVRLGMPNFCLRMLNIAHCEKELKATRVGLSAILSAAVGENAKHGHVELVEEGDYRIVERIGSRDWCFGRVELARSDL